MIEKLQVIIGQMVTQIAQLQAELEAAKARVAELEQKNEPA
jgi:cell division protein FtsB